MKNENVFEGDLTTEAGKEYPYTKITGSLDIRADAKLLTSPDIKKNARREARDGLMFKIGKRDPAEFKAWTPEKVVTKAEAIKAYRVITGACEGGVRAWMKNHKTPEKITVKEIITLTKGAYGAEQFAGFFKVTA